MRKIGTFIAVSIFLLLSVIPSYATGLDTYFEGDPMLTHPLTYS